MKRKRRKKEDRYQNNKSCICFKKYFFILICVIQLIMESGYETFLGEKFINSAVCPCSHNSCDFLSYCVLCTGWVSLLIPSTENCMISLLTAWPVSTAHQSLLLPLIFQEKALGQLYRSDKNGFFFVFPSVCCESNSSSLSLCCVPLSLFFCAYEYMFSLEALAVSFPLIFGQRNYSAKVLPLPHASHFPKHSRQSGYAHDGVYPYSSLPNKAATLGSELRMR